MTKQIKFSNFKTNSKFLRIFYLHLLLLVISCCYIACENEPGLIGQELIERPLIQKDTFEVFAKTIEGDAIVSNNSSIGLLGTYTDPIFGKGKASFVTEIFPSTQYDFVEDSVIVESIVLRLKYRTDYVRDTIEVNDTDSTKTEVAYNKITDRYYYGDSLQSQNVLVYELTSPLTSDTIYSNYQFTTDMHGELLGSKNYYPYSAKDNYLSIDLDRSLAERILYNMDSTTFASVTNFYDFLPGFYVTVDGTNENAAIVSFDLVSDSSSLTIKYHKIDDANKTLEYSFFINESCGSYNIYETESNKLISNDNDFIYTQAMGGVTTQISFPSVSEWQGLSPSSVSKAELIIPAENDTIYPIPEYLALYAYNDGSEIQLDEYKDPTNNIYFGEAIDEDISAYRFDITKYIQNLFDNKLESKGLKLFPYNNKNHVRRAILKNNPENKMKLIITYIELD